MYNIYLAMKTYEYMQNNSYLMKKQETQFC